MSKNFKAISDGTFILSETENKNQFYFYRNDGEILSDIEDGDLMRLYDKYMELKKKKGEIESSVIRSAYYEMSDDKRTIRLTVNDIRMKSK